MRLASGIGLVLGRIGTVLLLRPITFIGLFFIRSLRPVYRLLFTAKRRTRELQTGKGRSILAVVTSRYVIHATVIALTIAVAVNNLVARGVSVADVAGDSILAKTVSANYEDEEFVEYAPSPKFAYVEGANTLSEAEITEAETGEPLGAEGAVSPNENALQIPTDASIAGIAQRTDVTTYVVQSGDTLGGIAARFGVTQKTILAANTMSNADFIKPGQELIIPPITGVIHRVKSGDTIAALSDKYQVEAEEILEFNRLADPSAISVDQDLIIPGAEIPDIQPEVPAPTRPGQPYIAPRPGPVPGPAPAIGGGRMNWPTVGRRVNQYFRYGHTGIDAECAYGNPLYAARDGTVSGVIYQRYGYGYHITINHGGGVSTLYGHASKIFVKPGQRVSKGQSIAMCGSTGRSSGTHVHFEVMVGGRKVNPLTYL